MFEMVQWVPDYLYAGCYFSASAMQLISLLALAGVEIQNPTVPVQVDDLRCTFPQPGFCCGYGLLGYWICINELFDDSNAIAGGESCPLGTSPMPQYPMACCGDVRSVIFY